jgi:hypothetical protein
MVFQAEYWWIDDSYFSKAYGNLALNGKRLDGICVKSWQKILNKKRMP